MADSTPYKFNPAVPGIFAEVYFPKKAVYQGAIYQALMDGFDESRVKAYLTENVDALIDELERYGDRGLLGASREEALNRIARYRSVFYGYTLYTVDGVFFSKERKRPEEESVQVIRLMFTFEAEDELDRAAIRWFLRLPEDFPDEEDLERIFPTVFGSLAPDVDSARLRQIVYQARARVDDSALFVFGYLVRKFWNQVLQAGASEEEVWVTTFFNLGVNIIKRG